MIDKIVNFLSDYLAGKRYVSSGKWFMELCLFALCRSLITSKKGRYPKTDPCDTSCVILKSLKLHKYQSCIP